MNETWCGAQVVCQGQVVMLKVGQPKEGYKKWQKDGARKWVKRYQAGSDVAQGIWDAVGRCAVRWVGIVPFTLGANCKSWNGMRFQLLNHAGTSGRYNTKVFESTEMRGKLKEEIFQRLDEEVGVTEYLSGLLVAHRQLPRWFSDHQSSLDRDCHTTWHAVLFPLLYITDLEKKKN